MSKMDDAKFFLNAIGMPTAQQADVCCYSLLALAGVKSNDNWSKAQSIWTRIHDIIQFSNVNYGSTYAENSRETFRKQALHHFRTAAIVEDNGKSTNSPLYRYKLTSEALSLIQKIGSPDWGKSLSLFLSDYTTLREIYSSKKQMQKTPVKINNQDFEFSPGKHNLLQKFIIEEFAPRFAPGCEVLYVGDTIKKDLVKNIEKLKELGFSITLHDKMPDVVLYRQDNNWLYFVESVTSVGPMDSKRIAELSDLTKNVKCGKSLSQHF